MTDGPWWGRRRSRASARLARVGVWGMWDACVCGRGQGVRRARPAPEGRGRGRGGQARQSRQAGRQAEQRRHVRTVMVGEKAWVVVSVCVCVCVCGVCGVCGVWGWRARAAAAATTHAGAPYNNARCARLGLRVGMGGRAPEGARHTQGRQAVHTQDAIHAPKRKTKNTSMQTNKNKNTRPPASEKGAAKDAGVGGRSQCVASGSIDLTVAAHGASRFFAPFCGGLDLELSARVWWPIRGHGRPAWIDGRPPNGRGWDRDRSDWPGLGLLGSGRACARRLSNLPGNRRLRASEYLFAQMHCRRG